MTTGNFTDWSGNMLDLGPLYPFVGWEGVMVVLAFIAWIGWHILQMRAEKKQHDDQARAAAPGRQSGQGRRGGAPRRAVLAARGWHSLGREVRSSTIRTMAPAKRISSS